MLFCSVVSLPLKSPSGSGRLSTYCRFVALEKSLWEWSIKYVLDCIVLVLVVWQSFPAVNSSQLVSRSFSPRPQTHEMDF